MLDALAAINVIELEDDIGIATIVIDRTFFDTNKKSIIEKLSAISCVDVAKMLDYIENSFGMKVKTKSKPPIEKLSVSRS